MTVIREWRGRTSLAKENEYPEHFRQNVVPELQTTDGFEGAHLTRRTLAGGIEYLVLTRWSSKKAIRTFAGKDIDKAVVEPGAIAALTDYDDHVSHYEAIEIVVVR
ncbi:MAG: antibiotic biosynthesis monooxygenase [Pseudomonadota bacterium]